MVSGSRPRILEPQITAASSRSLPGNLGQRTLAAGNTCHERSRRHLGGKAHCHVREIKTQPALCTPRLPRTYALGEFEVRAGPAGAPFLANIARPWFTFGDGGDHATTGGWVRVMGEALALGPSIPLCRPNSSQLCSAGQLGVILACGTPARGRG